MRVLRRYWNRWRADEINNQSIANILVDWLWCSGKWGIVIPQRILGVVPDGIVGKRTLKAVNEHDQEALFDKIWYARSKFIIDIILRDPSQSKFRKGWMNRLKDFQFFDTL